MSSMPSAVELRRAEVQSQSVLNKAVLGEINEPRAHHHGPPNTERTGHILVFSPGLRAYLQKATLEPHKAAQVDSSTDRSTSDITLIFTLALLIHHLQAPYEIVIGNQTLC